MQQLPKSVRSNIPRRLAPSVPLVLFSTASKLPASGSYNTLISHYHSSIIDDDNDNDNDGNRNYFFVKTALVGWQQRNNPMTQQPQQPHNPMQQAQTNQNRRPREMREAIQ